MMGNNGDSSFSGIILQLILLISGLLFGAFDLKQIHVRGSYFLPRSFSPSCKNLFCNWESAEVFILLV